MKILLIVVLAIVLLAFIFRAIAKSSTSKFKKFVMELFEMGFKDVTNEYTSGFSELDNIHLIFEKNFNDLNENHIFDRIHTLVNRVKKFPALYLIKHVQMVVGIDVGTEIDENGDERDTNNGYVVTIVCESYNKK